jgi:hypothetical protein
MSPMKQLIWIALAVALVACSKKSDDAAKGAAVGGAGGGGAGGATCAAAVSKAVASLGAGMEASGLKEKLLGIYTTRCTEDGWPAEAIKCYETAVGMPGLTACRGKLPPEMGTKLITEIRGAMAGAAAGMGKPPVGHGGGAAGEPAPGEPAPAAPPAPAGEPAAAAGSAK